eukprot:CAMPEP_0185269212 /NCGR_PEP_ID=MMETSP1359-20130426/39154_1 /TAXON_ID=552665 /ORGANISM="Bigelowiella longifila, Strain CCMP242" /LENGTH=38 /DNA_ID= /DNA_START= /DNA_END= /DNA_ORIENTATION=
MSSLSFSLSAILRARRFSSAWFAEPPPAPSRTPMMAPA